MSSGKNTLSTLWGLISGTLGFVADVSAVSQLFDPSVKTVVFPLIDFEFRPLTGWIVTILIVSYVFLVICLFVFKYCEPEDGYGLYYRRDKKRPISISILIGFPVYLFHFYLLSKILGMDIPQMIEAESHAGLYYLGIGALVSYVVSLLISRVAETVFLER